MKFFTFCIVCLFFISARAEVGDTLYYEGFEVEDITSTVFQFNPSWSDWNDATIVDSVKYMGVQSLGISAGKGTWGEFNGKVSTWFFEPEKFYRIELCVKLDSARSIDVTRLSAGSVLYHNGVEIDAYDNGGEWVCNLNNENTAIKYDGNWKKIVSYIKIGPNVCPANGPSFGLGWGGKSKMYLDEIRVIESSEKEKNEEIKWVTDLSTGITNKEIGRNVFLYPNPAQDRVTISSDFKVNQVRVYSISGLLVKSIEVSGLNSFSTKGLASGMYTVLFQGNDSKASSKLVVE